MGTKREVIYNIRELISEIARHLMSNDPIDIQQYAKNMMEINISSDEIINYFATIEEEEDIREQQKILNFYEQKDVF